MFQLRLSSAHAPHKLPKASLLAGAALLGLWSLPSTGAQVNALFNVSVTLLPTPVSTPPVVVPGAPVITPPSLPLSAFCTKDNLPTARGAVVTVVCSTGAVVDINPGPNAHPQTPIHGGAYRYVTNVTHTGMQTDAENSFLGAGTTTAWRIVRLAERDYLEFTLGW